MSPSPTAVYRFGDFTFDATSGELSNAKAASVARLQPQVGALLRVLLDHPGEVVSRADLQSKLWPDTTVDFDDGLNFAVRQLRVALSDDANAPSYVETLPRRGYRFIKPVSRAVPGSDRAAPPASPLGSSPQRTRWLVALAVVIVLLIAFAFVSRRATVSPTVALAVLSFDVDTSDRMMATYHRQLLDQVTSAARQERSWRLVADTGAATDVLSGSLVRQGYSVRVFVQLVHRADHRHLWADSILDSYAFSGNSTLTADRIEKSVARLLGSSPSRR